MRGRKRSRRVQYPAHIDPGKLPTRCYWDASGLGHWYTIFRDEDGRQRRRKIAGPKASLADLHKLLEEAKGKPVDCLDWLAGKFEKSPQYPSSGSKNAKGYDYCFRVVSAHPTKKPGVTMGKIPLTAWTPSLTQKLIDSISEQRGPSTTRAVNSYLKRVFNWAKRRGYFASDNPAVGTELPKERKLQRLPDPDVVRRLSAFARERGARPVRSKGACPYYVWIVLEIAYQCRLRGIEVFSLTDEHILDVGVFCQRTKGSRANVTRYNDRLKSAIDAAIEARRAIWERRKMPIPMDPKQRLVLVGTEGQQIKPYAWQNTWRRFMAMAIEKGVITEEQRFGLHDMKRRGITDTKGDKMAAGGHRSAAMLEVYDKSVPVVDATAE